MVKKEDLHWSEVDTNAIVEYRKDFEAGKIPYTILTGSLKELTKKV